MANVLNQQTFTFSYLFDDQLKAFGNLVGPNFSGGIWYTGNVSLVKEGDEGTGGTFAPLLPALGDSFWFRWVWAEDYNGTNFTCLDPQPDNDDYAPGEYVSIFDYRATCVKSVTITPCSPDSGAPYGQTPTISFTRGGTSVGECQDGTLTVIPAAQPSYENRTWSQFNFIFGPAGPGPSLLQQASSEVASEAGYDDSSSGGSGVTLSDEYWEERKITILPDFSMRLGDSYYDTEDGFASQYGHWGESNSGQNIEISRSLPFDGAAAPTTYLGNMTSEFDNDYGNVHLLKHLHL